MSSEEGVGFMDLVKIGRYIADKRKALNLTQKQLAELLGMSDKSVSKWERGVCLPDISVYIELCRILGISINEFLAGEDIRQEDLAKKSESALIQIATDSKLRQNRLKKIIAVLLAVALLTVSMTGVILYRAHRPKNTIAPVARDSAEMKTAQLLSGVDGAFLFRYQTSAAFQSLTVYISEYRAGNLVEKTSRSAAYDGIASPSGGMIVIVPDFKTFTVKLILADESSRFSTEIPILDGVEDRAYYGRSATQIREETDIRFDEEHGLVALFYSENELHALDIREFEQGNIRPENDYVYYFSYQFCK